MPKIHQVKTRFVNSYVVEYAHALFVVDVAANGHKEVISFIENTLQRACTDLTWVFCTHDDPDHIGGVLQLAAACNAKIGIPYAANSSWRKIRHNPTGTFVRLCTTLRELLRPRAWDMYFNPRRNKKHSTTNINNNNITNNRQLSKKSTADIRLKHLHPLVDFNDWQVIHTPGHSWDSCCFFHARSGSLVSGDTLLGSAKKNKLFTPAIYADRVAMIRTLKYLNRLNIQHVYPGHGSTLTGTDIIAQAQVQ